MSGLYTVPQPPERVSPERLRVVSAKRKVVLCADDYGLSEAVSRGILELARMGRISATGAMTNCPAWRTMAAPLRELGEKVAVGLHLNLTAGAPLGPMPGFAPGGQFPRMGDVLARALTGRLPLDEIGDEIARQLGAFEEAFGQAPAFVDGHQHVHVLPGVRGALLRVLQNRGHRDLWLRDPSDGVRAILSRDIGARKALSVAALAFGFAAAARKAGFDTNEGFSGFSPFDPTVEPGLVFGAGFHKIGPRPVVMCHPGEVDEELRTLDGVVETRPLELRYLASDAFHELLEFFTIALARSPHQPPRT